MEENEIKIQSPGEIHINESDYPSQTQPAQPPITPSEPQGAPSNPPAPSAPPKVKSKARGLFIAIIALIIVALGTYTTVAIINRDNTTEPAPEQQPAEEVPTTASELQLSGNALSDFDLKFLQLENELDDKNDNKIYSPLSIKYALAMLKDAATGDAKAQIENLIGSYSPKAYANSANRSLANAIAINEAYKNDILPSYIDDLQKRYSAETLYDSFTNATAINQWVSDKTLGIINNLLQDDFNQDNVVAALLINALAIDMNWNYKIQCSDTVSEVPCKSAGTNMSYARENFTPPKVGTIANNQYESMAFDGQDGIKSTKFGATINNYDIKNEVGDEKIRATIKAEYEKWLVSDDVQDYTSQNGWDHIEQDADKFLETYLEQLYSNYGRFGSTTDFYVYDDASVKAFAKDLKEYDGDTLQYVAIMPKTTDLKTYVSGLTAKTTNGIISGLKDIQSANFKQGVITKITGQVPLFNFSYSLKLKEDLESLGVEDVFDDRGGNLLDMTTSEDIFITDAAHKANIDFSNEGIKAAATTVFLAGRGAAGALAFQYDWDVPVEEIDLTFDKPFLFIIRDKASGEVWFTGTVYEPALNQ